MSLSLRPYQARAVAATWDFLEHQQGNPCIVLPTGAGKSLVVAQLVTDAVVKWECRVLVVAHVKELLVQLAGALRGLCPDVSIGLYSAGLGARDVGACTIAGIQSIYRRATSLFPDGTDLLIIDEVHLLPPDGEGMYRSLIADLTQINPSLRVIGLTATPYRMTTGRIVGGDQILTAICHESEVAPLVRAGYLSPLRSIESSLVVDTSALHTRGGEFIESEAAALMDQPELVLATCQEIVARTTDRHSVLIFAADVEHGRHVHECLASLDQSASAVFGDTPDEDRAEAIAAFREGRIKYLVNVVVLTVGFDAPGIDCVVMLRPTLSPGLYYQMVGRGLRKAAGKVNCLVLDFVGNVNTHGPIDQLSSSAHEFRERSIGEAPFRTCPACLTAGIPISAWVCPDCGYQLREAQKPRHDRTPQPGVVMLAGGQPAATSEVLEVVGVTYRAWTKKGAPPEAPRTMRVDYDCGLRFVSEWVCVEHGGFAGRKAEQWWEKRCDLPMPTDASEAARLGNLGELLTPTSITVQLDGNFDRVIGYDLPARGDAWEPPRTTYTPPIDLDDIPF